MNELYQPTEIEADLQADWEARDVFKATEDLNKEKFYCLSMFPYPSGQLHMGHVRNYTIGDVIARYQRMIGKNVLQPIGWDAFGLPAENAAIKHKSHPAKWTYQNIADMKKQFKRLGFAYDWSREFATCQPEYYRWEQWLFTRLFKKGLVYKKYSMVNWDPVDQTVLANEQVVDGKGWRSGAPIERREIAQWFLKITAYAEELLAGLDHLPHWPEQVRTMQRNWIGRSQGVEIKFGVQDHPEPLQVFTTRADTLYGVTYLGIAPAHPLALAAAAKNPQIQAFLEECRHIKVAEAAMATMEKRGMATGFMAIHPLTQELIPIWIANFVLMEYGSGAVMAVPAHDQRDFEFAQKYHLPIKAVLEPTQEKTVWDYTLAPFLEKGILIHSGLYTGLGSEAAISAISLYLEQQGLGNIQTHYRLRDWGVSRQRYWGAPIPIIFCPKCEAVPVPEADLPVILPEKVEFTGPQSPLNHLPEFYETKCPQCGSPAKRETDTFDTFMESSWYYARFACPDQDQAMLDDRARYWTPVDQYVGGIEHAVMHLLYARFFHKLMRDEGLVHSDEPFTRLLTQGMVLKDGSKMSKSKGNIVDPNQMIDQYGADAVRVFMMFAAPPEQSLEWSDAGLEGISRFLKRIWAFAQEQTWLKDFNMTNVSCEPLTIVWEQFDPEYAAARREIQQILQKASNDFDKQQLNTVVSAGMKILNVLTKLPSMAQDVHHFIVQEGFSILLRLLAPMAPHITEKLWTELEFGTSILRAPWPKVNLEALRADSINLVLQVNGKLRGQLAVPTHADSAQIQEAALADEHIQKHLAGRTPVKIIIVPGKLVNIVVKD